jgi:hypothetical protein
MTRYYVTLGRECFRLLSKTIIDNEPIIILMRAVNKLYINNFWWNHIVLSNLKYYLKQIFSPASDSFYGACVGTSPLAAECD